MSFMAENFYKERINPFWMKYDEIINKMSKEEMNFVAKQENVILAKQNLMSTFLEYLLEKEKNNFITIDAAKIVTENYLSEIESASKKYVSRAETLETENLELKKQIEELLKKSKVKDD